MTKNKAKRGFLSEGIHKFSKNLEATSKFQWPEKFSKNLLATSKFQSPDK
jgi:hypothetical protein